MKAAFYALGIFCLVAAIQAAPFGEDIALQGFQHLKSEVEASHEGQVFVYEETQRPLQVHHNIFQGQGPFAGRLLNSLLNEKGEQETKQSNRIAYNFDRLNPMLGLN